MKKNVYMTQPPSRALLLAALVAGAMECHQEQGTLTHILTRLPTAVANKLRRGAWGSRGGVLDANVVELSAAGAGAAADARDEAASISAGTNLSDLPPELLHKIASASASTETDIDGASSALYPPVVAALRGVSTALRDAIPPVDPAAINGWPWKVSEYNGGELAGLTDAEARAAVLESARAYPGRDIGYTLSKAQAQEGIISPTTHNEDFPNYGNLMDRWPEHGYPDFRHTRHEDESGNTVFHISMPYTILGGHLPDPNDVEPTPIPGDINGGEWRPRNMKPTQQQAELWEARKKLGVPAWLKVLPAYERIESRSDVRGQTRTQLDQTRILDQNGLSNWVENVRGQTRILSNWVRVFDPYPIGQKGYTGPAAGAESPPQPAAAQPGQWVRGFLEPGVYASTVGRFTSLEGVSYSPVALYDEAYERDYGYGNGPQYHEGAEQPQAHAQGNANSTAPVSGGGSDTDTRSDTSGTDTYRFLWCGYNKESTNREPIAVPNRFPRIWGEDSSVAAIAIPNRRTPAWRGPRAVVDYYTNVETTSTGGLLAQRSHSEHGIPVGVASPDVWSPLWNTDDSRTS